MVWNWVAKRLYDNEVGEKILEVNSMNSEIE